MAIISICRGIYSGGEELAESLGKRLGYKVVSREYVIERATTYGVSEDELLDSLRSPPTFWEKLSNKRQRFLLAVVATLSEMVKNDNVVYHGMAGHLLLKELPNHIKLLLAAPLESRIRAAMQALNVSQEDAAKLIEESDAKKLAWMRRMYNVKPMDTSLYDLVVNLDRMNVASATDLIVGYLEQSDFRSTPETRQALHDFALRLKIKAELTFRSDFPEDSVDVSVLNGVAGLTIAAKLKAQRDAIVDFVKQIPGVTEVDTGERMMSAEKQQALQSRMTAGDLMVPLDKYPHINQSVTIKEAVMAMTASSVLLPDGHTIVPRYLLVLDENDRLVGVINRRHLLRGLSPQYESLMDARKQLAAKTGLASDMMSTSLVWDALFGPGAVNAARRPVSSIMIPASVTADRGDTLGTVVSTMLQNDIDVLPVSEGGKTVGAVLMTEVFDNVAEFIIESAAKSRAAH